MYGNDVDQPRLTSLILEVLAVQIQVENAELMTESQRKFKEAKQRTRLTQNRDASNLERLKAFRASMAARSKAALAPPSQVGSC